MKAKLISLLLTVVLVVATLVVAGCKAEEQAEEKVGEVPELVKLSGWDIGSGIYMIQTAIGDAVVEKYGTKVRAIPSTSLIGRYIPLSKGEVDFCFDSTSYIHGPEGLYDFAEIEWGPQDVQMCWGFGSRGHGPAVRGDSDIYTLADLRGKRVPYFVGSSSSTYCTLVYLNFAGLTWDDVVRVDVSGYTAGTKMLDEGKIDVCHLIPTGPQAMEIASHPWGLRWLEMPASDTEGWARVQAMVPLAYLPATITAGAGIDEAHPVEVWAPPLGIAFQCMSWAPEDMVYFWTKALHELYLVYYPAIAFIAKDRSIEEMLDTWSMVNTPMHKGAIRYFKEVGVWTDELEARNNQMLEHIKTLREIFDRAKETALEQGMKAADFPAFWIEQRTAAGYPVTSVD